MLPQKPYIAGNAVGGGERFVGRNDVLRKVLSKLRPADENAIVLFGQRRIGKTSILQELKAKLPEQGNYLPIYFDLQDKTTWPLERLLRALAKEISHGLQEKNLQVQQPDLGDDPETTFREVWLPQMLDTLSTETSLVFLFDEFDVLDDPDKPASQDFFPYLKALLTIDLQRLNFVFVIGRQIHDLNTLDSVFKGIDQCRVSLLEYKETVEIIRFSDANHTLNWTTEAIEKIWQQTSGHPYLTQSLCSRVWDNFYDYNPKELPTATLEEVKTAIPEALEASRNALEWLWKGLPPAERFVTSALASASETMTTTQLEFILRNSGVQAMIGAIENAPKLLLDWDLIEQVNDGYRFRVALLRSWITKYKPLSEVQKELDRIHPVADGYYQAGAAFYRNRELIKAVDPLRSAVSVNPNHVGANKLLAEILLAEKQYDEACDILERLYQSKPDDETRTRLITALLGLASEANKSEDEQLKLYDRVLDLDSENSKAKSRRKTIWQKRGDNAYEKGDLENALEAYRKANIEEQVVEIEEKIRTRSQLPQWYQQAQDALKKSDNQKAQTLLARIIAIKPTYEQASRYLHLAVTDIDPVKLKKKWNWSLGMIVVLTLCFLAAISHGILRYSVADKTLAQVEQQLQMVQDSKEQLRIELEQQFRIELAQKMTTIEQLKNEIEELKK